MTAPADFAGSIAGQVIGRALQRGRLAHALLLHGAQPEGLEAFARQLVARLLDLSPAWAGSTSGHADCFTLRPSGKMRQIKIGENAAEPNSMRHFIRQLAQSPLSSARKVGVVFDAERLNANSANAFLKTLEEPPADTTILLLTTSPYSLLPTIRSRCLSFRLPAGNESAGDPARQAWLSDYREWLAGLAAGGSTGAAASRQVITVYALTARFSLWIDAASARAIERLRADGALEQLDDDETDALKKTAGVEVRRRFFAAIATATSEVARSTGAPTPALAASVQELERAAGLLEVNFNENSALELFLLSALRAWARRDP